MGEIKVKFSCDDGSFQGVEVDVGCGSKVNAVQMSEADAEALIKGCFHFAQLEIIQLIHKPDKSVCCIIHGGKPFCWC